MKEIKICVIGLGYVGLPLARLFSTKYKTVGFDMNPSRVAALMAGHDATLEVSDELLQSAIRDNGFVCTSDLEEIRGCNFYVVAVPTPVDENNNPDLTPLYGASTTVGKVISKGDIVVYESTVYPGVTEDECIPVVEKGIQVLGSDILILGFTFKENCPDVRNTKVIDIYKALKEYNVNVTVYDPWANPETVKHEYGIQVTNELPNGRFDTAVLAVAHRKFEGLDVPSLLNDRHVIFDVKAFLDRKIVDGRL